MDAEEGVSSISWFHFQLRFPTSFRKENTDTICLSAKPDEGIVNCHIKFPENVTLPKERD